SVRGSLTLRQGSHRAAIAVCVATDQSGDTAPCSDNRVSSDIPNGYAVRRSHALSAFARGGICQCLHHPIKARPVLAQLCPAPNVLGGASLPIPDRPAVSNLWAEPHRDAPWLHCPEGHGTRGEAQPHLVVFVLPSPDTRNIPGPNDTS